MSSADSSHGRSGTAAKAEAPLVVGAWESPDGADDWLLYDAIREHAGLSIGQARAVLPIVHAWLETYTRAGVGIGDAQSELELM